MSQASSGWTGFAERGSLGALRLAQGFHRPFGRRITRAILPIAAYFAVTASGARRASREYLETLYASPGGAAALRRRPRRRDVVRHFHEFSVNLVDRMVVWGGAIDSVQFEHRSEHLFRLAREKRGGILVGSHVGSFDMMRLLAGRYGLVVNVLMFTRHAEQSRPCERDAKARGWLADYAGRLEACCWEEPYQWFNFYPFRDAGEEVT